MDEQIENALKEMDKNQNGRVDMDTENAKKFLNVLKKDIDTKLLYQIASSLKSTRFILAVLTIIPSMAFFGYSLVALEDPKDKLIVIGIVNAIVLMVLTFYFSDKLQEKTENGNGADKK